jgi:hypothetical protein
MYIISWCAAGGSPRPWVPPLAGCCAQVALLVIAMAMTSMAGPVN